MTTEASGSATHPTKAAKKDTTAAAESAEPIIIDMGKKNRKQVRKLRKGKPGRLMNRVEEAVEHLRENGALAADAQPIVIIVKERKRRRNKRLGKMWGLG